MVKNNRQRAIGPQNKANDGKSTQAELSTGVKWKASIPPPTQRSPGACKQRKIAQKGTVEANASQISQPGVIVKEGRRYFTRNKNKNDNHATGKSTVVNDNLNAELTNKRKLKGTTNNFAGTQSNSQHEVFEDELHFDSVMGDNATHFIADGVRVDVHDPNDSEFHLDDPLVTDQMFDHEIEEGEWSEEELEPSSEQEKRYVGKEPNESVNSDTNDSEIVFNFRKEAEVQPQCSQDEQGACSQEEQEAAKLLADNPRLGNIFQKWIQEGVQQEVKKHVGTINAKKQGKVVNNTSIRNEQGNGVMVKSPSDTTIYAPAFHRLNSSNKGISPAQEVVDKITNFVEGIRLETESQNRVTPNANLHVSHFLAKSTVQDNQPSTSHSGQTKQQKCTDARQVIEKQFDEEQETEVRQSRQAVIDGEKFKINIEPPPKGNFLHRQSLDIDLVKRSLEDDEDDDDYFHLTCQVDKTLKAKIELGEFVELEKLLPKRRTKNGSDDNRLEWVSRDGMTFLAPAQDRDNQINGIRRWQQAFRVYAAIYCNANPS